MSVVMFERTPVTPSEDTQYTKPEASFAIIADAVVRGRRDERHEVDTVLTAQRIKLGLFLRTVRPAG